MPELPEVETIRRGIAPWLTGRRIERVVIREPRLRWPIPAELAGILCSEPLTAVERRSKYLLLRNSNGAALWHMGMSGSLRVMVADTPPGPHDHVDLVLDSGHLIRFNDPRRFGSLLWASGDPFTHPLLVNLGPEPLGPEFSAAYLVDRCRGRRTAIKPHLMNAAVVVGVGNIYANEALFRAGIHPARQAGRIGAPRLIRLVDAIRDVLREAISAGGTTLRDFHDGTGRPGYFSQALRAYGRGGEPCLNCGAPLRQVVLAQRATCYCPACQR